MKIRDEFPFVLPRGIGVENEGNRKVAGAMRFIKVKDLVAIHQDNRVKENPGYFYIILLSRVVVRLGGERMVTTRVIERLSPEDFAFLVDMSNQINHQIIKRVSVDCEQCGQRFIGEFSTLGEV
jgi:hypothetical protein